MIRRATEADLAALRALYLEFHRECPPPAYVPHDWDEEWRELEETVRGGVALLAEEDGEPIGLAVARRKGPRLGYLADLYVRPQARRQGVAKALVREVASAFAAQGVDYVNLNVDAGNRVAQSVYERFGFREESLYVIAETAKLVERLSAASPEPSHGAVYVQTDEQVRVERAVRQFVPRLGRSERTVVSPPRDGWIAVWDELCDREPKLLRRLARELSDRMGAVVLALGVEEGRVVRYVLFDRGAVADEYLSVPEYFGPLPPGDVIALGANPTVAARLTGADPARLRAVARTAASPAELPPAPELLAELAEALGVPVECG